MNDDDDDDDVGCTVLPARPWFLWVSSGSSE